MKFQRPEVDKNADVDKEILKIVIATLKAYNFMDFNLVELDNVATANKIIMNQRAVLEKHFK
jgi:hypothetical protein